VPVDKQRAIVNGHAMAYVDRGRGAPIVLLHGNPTSSFLWRDIMTPLSARARTIAPDLIGMGDSDKLADSGPHAYSFAQHRAFLAGFMDQLVPSEPVILVVHDWGSALGFDWARRHPERVRGLVYMEAIVGTMRWAEWDLGARMLFKLFRSRLGEWLVLRHNLFIELVLKMSVLRALQADELAAYRRPFLTAGETRRPMLSFPRQLPIDGQPADVCAEVEAYASWLPTTRFPKLFVNAEPGRILTGRLRAKCREWPNQDEVTVRGDHFLQEDSAAEIAGAIDRWLDRVIPSTRQASAHD
jgi:haloalkane dehalogenase